PAPPGTTAPGAEPLRMTGGFGGRTGGTSSSTGGQSTTTSTTQGTGAAAGTTPTTAAAREGANPAAEPLSAQAETGGAEGENRIRIIANRRNNALLVYATPSEYTVIEGMLRKLDIIPLQVLIEATIAEVTLNDALNYGTQFYLGHTFAGILTGAGSTTSSDTTTGTTPITVGGVTTTIGSKFPGFVVANGVREVVNALSSVTQVKVLSAPQVMVLDNEPARLQVGSLVPVLTQSQQSTVANSSIVNSVDYRDTGVIMLVTPRVNSGGLVTLDISQEVSDVATVTTGNIDSPTFNQRLIRTRIAVQDGQPGGMAALISARESQGQYA